MSGNTDWKNLEEMVERLQRAFHPRAIVTRNDRLKGYDSERSREIDISIRYDLGTTNLLMIVDCKRRSRKIDLNQFAAFQGLMKDVRAHAGIMVCDRGFSKPVKRLARKNNIELFTFHDTQSADWQIKIRVPVFVDQLVLIPRVLNLVKTDGTNKPLSDDRELNIIDTKTGENIRVANLLVSAWDAHPDKKDGVFTWEYNMESGSQAGIEKLQIGCGVERQRFTRQAILSLIGLTKIEDGLTYTDKLDVATDDTPATIHTDPSSDKLPMEGAPWGVLIKTTITKTVALEKSGFDLKKNSIALSMTSGTAKPIGIQLTKPKI